MINYTTSNHDKPSHYLITILCTYIPLSPTTNTIYHNDKNNCRDGYNNHFSHLPYLLNSDQHLCQVAFVRIQNYQQKQQNEELILHSNLLKKK